MKATRRITLAGLAVAMAVLLVVGCAPSSAAPAKGKRLVVNMGTTNASSSLYIYGIALAKVFNDNIPEMQVTALETGAGHDNIRRLREGEIKIASIMAYGAVYEAWAGKFTWEGKPDKKIRTMPSYGAKQYLQVVRGDSGIAKPEQLEGKPFNPGLSGGYAESTTKAVYETLGIRPDWKPGGTAEAVTNIKDRRWVGYSKPAGGMTDLDASTLDILSTTEIRVLSFTREQMEKAKKAYPHIEWYTVPANGYRQLKAHPEIISFGSGACTIVRDDMPVDITYKMSKAMVDNQKYLASTYAGVGEVTHGQTEIEYSMGFPDFPPLAAGFVRLCEERGIKVPARLIPPEYKPAK